MGFYIEPLMRRAVRPIISLFIVFFFGACQTEPVEPEEHTILSELDLAFNDLTGKFYVAVLVAPPGDAAAPDTLFAHMRLASGSLADSMGTDSVWASVSLNDSAATGDILPRDDIYSVTFPSPLPAGTGGAVAFTIIASFPVDADTLIDTLKLENLPPVITQITAASSMDIPPEGFVSLDTIRVSVADPDGLTDIQTVAFLSLKPDSTWANGGQPIPLADNGDSEYGDALAGDGVFSRIIQLPPASSGTQVGTYRYYFYARDYGGAVSDTSIHSVTVN